MPVIFGAGLILLLLPLRRDLGSVATVTAAVLLAVSPAMVFYSRYYIQEMLLVFFAALALGALWRYLPHAPPALGLLLGLAVGLMYATKETSVIFGGAMAAAYGCAQPAAALPPWPTPVASCQPRGSSSSAAGVGVAAMVAGLFYSSFLANPRGPLDSLLAFRHYLDRSGGDGSAALHQQPWYYYLKMLCYTKDAPGPWWSEGLILALAAVGLIAASLPAGIRPATSTQPPIAISGRLPPRPRVFPRGLHPLHDRRPMR